MMRIAITGSSGYLGQQLVRRLVGDREVETVVGIDTRDPKDPHPKLNFYARDVTVDFHDVFITEKVDVAVHLAFVVRPSRDERGVRQINVGGTERFIAACRESGLRHAVYLSSTTAYGAYADNVVPLTEESPLRPNEAFQYSKDKAAADILFQRFGEGTERPLVTVLRSCPVIGPNSFDAIGARVFQPIMIRVLGHDPPMQFIHEDDLINLLVYAIKEKMAGIFNVAGEGLVGYSELATVARKPMLVLPRVFLSPLLQATWWARLQSASSAAGLVYIMHPWVVDAGRFVREGGFRYRYSSEDAVRCLLQG